MVAETQAALDAVKEALQDRVHEKFVQHLQECLNIFGQGLAKMEQKGQQLQATAPAPAVKTKMGRP